MQRCYKDCILIYVLNKSSINMEFHNRSYDEGYAPKQYPSPRL